MSDVERLAAKYDEASAASRKSPKDGDLHAKSLVAAKKLADAREQARRDEGREGMGIIAEGGSE